jgi:hypothetical protein
MIFFDCYIIRLMTNYYLKYKKYKRKYKQAGGQPLPKNYKLDKFNKLSSQIYSPDKYFDGLTLDEKNKRLERMIKGTKMDHRDSEAYKPFETDYRNGKRIKTKQSGYTKQWKKHYPNITSLKDKSEITGVPIEILEKINKKGQAAWRTGHRPGANTHQWGHARVNSFIMKGKTFYTADNKLANEALTNPNAKEWFNSLDGLCDEPNVKKWCKPKVINFGQ